MGGGSGKDTEYYNSVLFNVYLGLSEQDQGKEYWRV